MRNKNIIGLILIVTGIIIAIIPISYQLYNKYQQTQMINSIKQEIAKNVAMHNTTGNLNQSSVPEDSNLTDQPSDQFTDLELDANQGGTTETSNPDSTQESDETESDQVEKILQYQTVIGIIEINELDIIFPIVEGANRDNIRAAIGHMKGTAEPGTKGNCVLAGHRGGIYGEFFKHLNKLKKKDKVKITDAMGREYNYQVYDQFVVEPTDVYVTNSIKEEKTLTLVTCENNGTKRLIVRCRLTD